MSAFQGGSDPLGPEMYGMKCRRKLDDLDGVEDETGCTRNGKICIVS
jgi:hypothetical protein